MDGQEMTVVPLVGVVILFAMVVQTGVQITVYHVLPMQPR